MATDIGLKDLREKISKVTLEILRLCAQRVRLTKKVAEIKAQKNKPVENLEVEAELRKEVLDLCQNSGVDRDFCIELLEVLFNESKRVQREILQSQS